MQNEQLLQAAFSRALAVSDDTITENLCYQSIPEWDSLGHISLIEELENTFNIRIKTEDILSLTSYTEAKNILKFYNIEFQN